MTERLNVFLKGVLAGTLDWSSDNGAMSFIYAPSFLADSESSAISMSLPLRMEPFNAYETRVFFENLLPPEVVRRKLEKILHHDYRNVFAFLKELGGDCAGAISLYPDGVDPNLAQDSEKELSDSEAHEVLSALQERPLLQGMVDGYRISVAGAQAKLVARIRDGKIALPLFGSPSTHIIKPGMSSCEHTVENECFCQKLAERIGIAAAQCGILQVAGSRYYATERYDRGVQDGRVVRFLQEDLCQAMGIDAEAKYQDDGGPSIVRCFNFLRDNGFGFADLERFLDLCIYNFLIGNADAHGKNFAILNRPDGRSLAPAYDEMSTVVYRNIANRLAMSIGGAYEFSDVTRDSFMQLAAKCDINPKLVTSRIEAMTEKLPRFASSLKEELSDFGYASPVYEQICAVISEHSFMLS